MLPLDATGAPVVASDTVNTYVYGGVPPETVEVISMVWLIPRLVLFKVGVVGTCSPRFARNVPEAILVLSGLLAPSVITMLA